MVIWNFRLYRIPHFLKIKNKHTNRYPNIPHFDRFSARTELPGRVVGVILRFDFFKDNYYKLLTWK